MPQGKKIQKNIRAQVVDLRGIGTASEIAEEYGISERSVIRIWSEESNRKYLESIYSNRTKSDELSRDGKTHLVTTPEHIQIQTFRHYVDLIEAREKAQAMADAYPTNAAWSNLAERYSRQIGDVLRIMGNWFGLEKRDVPVNTSELIAEDIIQATRPAMFDYLKKLAVLNELGYTINSEDIRARICEIEEEVRQEDKQNAKRSGDL